MLRGQILKFFSRQLKLNMLSGLLTAMASAGVNFVSYHIYLSALGYETLGVWFVLTSILSFSQLGGLGLMPALMKFVSESTARRDSQSAVDDTVIALGLVFLTSVGAFLLLYFGRGLVVSLFGLASDHAAVAHSLLPFLGLLVLPTLSSQVLGGAIGGMGRLDLYNYTHTIGRITAVGGATLMLHNGLGVSSLLIANGIAQLVVLSILVAILVRQIGAARLRAPSITGSRVKELLSFGTTLLAGSALSLLVSPTNKLLVSRFVGVGAVTVFEICYQASYQLRGLIEAAFRAFTPEAGRIHSDLGPGRLRVLKRLISRSTLVAGLVAAPLLVGLLLLTELVLRLWLRDSFSPALIAPFQIMVAGTMVSLLAVPSVYVLVGIGKPIVIRKMYQIQLAVNLSLAAALLAAPTELTVVSAALCVVCGILASSAYVFQARRTVLHRLTDTWGTRPGPLSGEL